MSSHEQAAPVDNKLFTPGVMVLVALMFIGLVFAAARFLFGLGAVTNLNNQFPWGLWIGIDVATGVALAAGGFTTGALAYIFNRHQYHAVIRPALLTAMLGYTFVVLGLLVDIGRYWNMWRPMVSWNPKSVLFEVAICVMLYSNLLYIEFVPIVVERFKGKVSLPGRFRVLNEPTENLLELADRLLGKVMFLFIIAGIVLSCLHQSGLGSLMLITGYKVHPLWYTPILPLLFLLSAIAVGYPMVAFESIITSKSLKRELEMEVLTPLARIMPVLIGVYLAFKLGDMLVRGTYTYLLDGTLQSIAFVVEVLLGVILPFVLLLSRKVRESAGWLFFACSLYVVGVVLNRVNVFLISYTPPYMMERYVPAIGEIAITVGLVAALIFLYRVCITVFPVLTAHKNGTAKAAVILLASSLVLWVQAPAYGAEAAATEGKKAIPIVAKVIPFIDDTPKVRILKSPVIKNYDDLYESVRFGHRKHVGLVKDCTICHHRTPREEGDTYGQPATMSELISKKTLPKSCATCHDHPFKPGNLHVPGLKGAYHRQCLNCHREAEQRPEGAGAVQYRGMVKGIEAGGSLVSRAPLDCISCHGKKVPDHRELVKLEGEVDVSTVTKNCLSCHQAQGEAMLKSAHWNWQGPSPFTVGNEMRSDLGKRSQTMSNAGIALSGNWARCTGCHAGYGWQDENFDFTDVSKIDCLVCHDTTKTYRKSSLDAGMPEKDVDLLKVAQRVGKVSRLTCGTACHFSGGTADPISHGSLNGALLLPNRNLDIHMAVDGQNLRCVDCHKTRRHQISGRSISVPEVEGYFSCQFCHTEKPHISSSLLNQHLNKHTEHLACQTCHIPVYAKANPTITRWDWSTAGKESNESEASEGMPTFLKEFGSLSWRETIKPSYLWYSGTVSRHLVGDRINGGGVTELTKPEGNRQDPYSKIYPFKRITGKQISDAVYKYLITPKLWQEYWRHWDWDRASRQGMNIAGLPYSGKYEFVETVTHQGLNHEVLPKERSLSCAQCHSALAKESSCERCHQVRADIDFKNLASKGINFSDLVQEGHDAEGFIGMTDYIDFETLGYAGDPIEVGGRFKQLPLEMRVKRKGEEKSLPGMEGEQQPPREQEPTSS